MESDILPAHIYLETDYKKSEKMVYRILENNETRQSLQSDAETKAFKMLEGWNQPDYVFVSSTHFHRGIIGLIATKLSQHFNRPSFVGSENSEGMIVGSSRTPPGSEVSLVAALKGTEKVLNMEKSSSLRTINYYGAKGRNDLILSDAGGSPHTGPYNYALTDAMGSTMAAVDNGGSVTQRYRYTAFGELTILTTGYGVSTATVPSIATLFHGEARDAATGWYNYGYRYYLPALGRWPSRDPIGEDGGVNLYGFVGNDGLNRSDHFGMYSFGCGYGALYEEGCPCPLPPTPPPKRDCNAEYMACIARGAAVVAAYKITCEILCAPALSICKYYCGITAAEVGVGYKVACDKQKETCEEETAD